MGTMSVLSAEVHEALGHLLQGLQSSDNTIRLHAESELNSRWVLGQPDVLSMGLVEQIQGASEVSV